MVFNLWHAIELKLPLLLLILLVWWFIREEPEDASADEEGGTHVRPAKSRPTRRPGPGGRGPFGPRRGPHGDPAPAAPTRIRTVNARARVHHRSSQP